MPEQEKKKTHAVTIRVKRKVVILLLLLSLHHKFNAVSCIQFGLVISGDHPQLQDMKPRFNPIQGSLPAREHSHQLAVDVGVHVMAMFALCQFEPQRDCIGIKDLIRFGRNDLDTGAFCGL